MIPKLNMGIAWFYEEDWKEWKKISADEIEDNYEDWLLSATMMKKDLEKEGHKVEKVFIKPKEFKEWCKKNKKRLDSSSRSDYVTRLLLEKDKKNK